MKIGELSCCLVAAVAFGSLFAGSPTFAEQMDCSGTKKSKERPYTEVIRPGDRPDHEMRQAIRTHVISSKDADFDGSEQTVYAHEDSYANAASGIDGISAAQSGTSVGYFLYTLKNGEKIWAKFDSVYSTSSGAPAYSTTSTQGSWEVTYQGVFHFVGGTGKYAGIRGGGHYKGKVTPTAGFEENSVCSAQY
jgi:hypothetical protein